MKTVPTTSFHNENVGPERFSQFTEAAQLFRMILGREPGVVWLQSRDFPTGSPSRLHAARSTACEISLNDTHSPSLCGSCSFFQRKQRVGSALSSDRPSASGPMGQPLLYEDRRQGKTRQRSFQNCLWDVREKWQLWIQLQILPVFAFFLTDECLAKFCLFCCRCQGKRGYLVPKLPSHGGASL